MNSKLSAVVVALSLLPAVALVPACDDKEPSGPVVDDDDDSVELEDDDGGTPWDDDDDSDSEPPPPKPKAAVPCSDEWERECTTEGGADGVTFCVLHEGEQVWTACATAEPCMPGESWDFGCMGSVCYFDGEHLATYSWQEPDCNTPLVLNFDGAPLTFSPASAASFDINATGECLSTDWPTLPWLARDVDGDGEIDSGRELFGSGTRLRSGARASDGFMALAELDSDGDGKITPADPAFAELVLWSDSDDDRRGQLGELTPVSSLQLTAIHLDYAVRGECDERGNCGRERSAFEFRGPGGERRVGEVVDVYLACQ
ncbi:MAG: calcium-binding protein [Nannocystaceae bacterium]